MLDQYQRPLRDLRISVTDRCNFRCTYCMPREQFLNHTFLSRDEILSFEEIVQVARTAVELGVEKIRITGGEPLVRHQLHVLIQQLAQLRTPEHRPLDIALTTNGVLLPQQAHLLKQAGLSRLSISLDGLSDSVFQTMSDSAYSVKEVLRGISAAQQAGLTDIKVNMVVKRGVNEHEVLTMAEQFRDAGIILRFIEYMDVGCTNGWQRQQMVPADDILRRIQSVYPLEPLVANYAGEVADRWRYVDGAGEIGVIASVTQPFCRDCTRLRLSTDGRLFNCLFAADGLSIKPYLRPSPQSAALKQCVADYWRQRHNRYSEMRFQQPAVAKVEMSYIGG